MAGVDQSDGLCIKCLSQKAQTRNKEILASGKGKKVCYYFFGTEEDNTVLLRHLEDLFARTPGSRFYSKQGAKHYFETSSVVLLDTLVQSAARIAGYHQAVFRRRFWLFRTRIV
jgi:hypothetical protein